MIESPDVDVGTLAVHGTDKIAWRQGLQLRRSAQPASQAFPEARAGCSALAYSGLLLGLPLCVDPRQSQADGAFVANREAELVEPFPAHLRLDQSLLIKQLDRRPLPPRGDKAHYSGARQLGVLGWLG